MTTPSGRADQPDAWRDEERLPLSELGQAMATYSQDGQVDDLTGADAGAEEEFGNGPRPRERSDTRAGSGHPGAGSPGAGGTEDPDPDSEAGRRLRPSPDGSSATGRTGPN